VTDTTVDIPDRAFFKASEVCELAQIQPYVLRTWELEFATLGVARPGGGARLYRRQDVERVLRIKQLVFTEGLTIAGARRKIEGEPEIPGEPASFETFVGPEVRGKLADVKTGLRTIFEMLAPDGPARESSRKRGGLPRKGAVPRGPAALGELFPVTGESDAEVEGGTRLPQPPLEAVPARKGRSRKPSS
jgi:DNA-binding transcriptional MerR regulator